MASALSEALLAEMRTLRRELLDFELEGRTGPNSPTRGNGSGTTDADGRMTSKDAAAYLRLPSVRALYQSVRRRQVPVHRLGSRLRFLKAELDEVLRRR